MYFIKCSCMWLFIAHPGIALISLCHKLIDVLIFKWLTSGSISVNSFQTGLLSNLAHRSHRALLIAATARWVTPFSGPTYWNNSILKLILVCKFAISLIPTHLNWDSLVNSRQNCPKLANISPAFRPVTKYFIALTASRTMSVPRPKVKVNPFP